MANWTGDDHRHWMQREAEKHGRFGLAPAGSTVPHDPDITITFHTPYVSAAVEPAERGVVLTLTLPASEARKLARRLAPDGRF